MKQIEICKTLNDYIFVSRTMCFPGLFCSLFAPKQRFQRAFGKKSVSDVAANEQ